MDLHLTTADTVKAVMLRDSTAAAVTALRSALADPGRCEIDALVATRIAGMATIDTDATAYASVPVLHALSSSCAGALPSPAAVAPTADAAPGDDDGVYPYYELSALFLPAVLRAVDVAGSYEEKAAMAGLAESVVLGHRSEGDDHAATELLSGRDLATYLDSKYKEHGMPTIRALLRVRRSSGQILLARRAAVGHPPADVDYTARLIALAVFNSALVRDSGSRSLPSWFQSIDDVLALVTDAMRRDAA